MLGFILSCLLFNFERNLIKAKEDGEELRDNIALLVPECQTLVVTKWSGTIR